MPAPVPLTQRKLREAQFFLSRLESQVCTPDGASSEEAEFYLSAFLSAARSVTFVLESEQPGSYKAWSVAWRASRSDRERLLLSRFTDARNRALKRETPSVATDQTAFAPAPSTSLHPELIFFFDDEPMPIYGFRALKCRLMPGDPEEHVVPLCREYETLLSTLVREFLVSDA